MRNQDKSAKTWGTPIAATVILGSLMGLLLVTAANSFAEQSDAAAVQASWGDTATAKDLNAARPVVVNPEEVEMLRRLLGVPAPSTQAAVAAPAAVNGTSVSEEVAPIGDSPAGNDGSATAIPASHAANPVW